MQLKMIMLVFLTRGAKNVPRRCEDNVSLRLITPTLL